ncbi:hypothetical protein PUN28_011529 [Cardiocondyla obscurior]|uniref:Uncharacterized protein n=1 Tax=Cardiocondyla obscurior TaxID=286306 RepID=A0AAW2FIX7_9HYME
MRVVEIDGHRAIYSGNGSTMNSSENNYLVIAAKIVWPTRGLIQAWKKKKKRKKRELSSNLKKQHATLLLRWFKNTGVV